ncbi:ras-related protein Rap-2c-like [Dreissena polymorpha]|uniref:GTP-binding protein Rhes n=1 Tax=Dreissena polymorpha TaxID=45954 RepID=A0A9D4MPT9_DREPO|nr:ras-related protein Rap-2c-like [Dreissena polymorpha]KAH3880283.1 hypothetical protein DPMN_004193 [Dreissena polymorpha]
MRMRALTTPSTKARIVLLGSKFVGKTTIAEWFVQKRKVTELHSMKSRQHVLMSQDFTVDLIDTDETALPALIKMNIRRADAFVLVYAVDDFYSFEYIRCMRDAIVKIRTADVPIVVVGNKIDIPEREVHPVVADCLVTVEWEHPHVEISAQNGDEELTAIFEELFLHPALNNETLMTGAFGSSQTTASRRKTRSSLPTEVQQSTSTHFKPQKKNCLQTSAFRVWTFVKNIIKK